MEEPNNKGTRKLVVNFEKRRLHASIMLHMRRMKIPMSMIGADLLKGVVFGVLRHPEISIREALENAVNASKVPGTTMTMEDGLDYIMEIVEISAKSDISEEDRTLEEKEKILEEVVNNIIAEINKEFCYEITIKILNKKLKGFRKYTIGGDFIKCMLFKKLYAPESTYDCMCDYALRKVGSEIDENDFTMEKAMEYVKPFLGKNASEQALKKLLEDLEGYVYKENQ